MTTIPPAKTKGRPRAYDPDAVLDQVLEIFWQKGYAATSLDELAAATGVNRPSLYAGFGDKQALYLKAMDRFADRVSAPLVESLSRRLPGETAADALERGLSMMVDLYTARPDGGLGCAVFCTSVTEAAGNLEIREMLRTSLSRLDALYEDFLRKAQADGELPTSLDVAGTARLISAVMQSLGIRARGGQSPTEIRQVSRAVADLLRR